MATSNRPYVVSLPKGTMERERQERERLRAQSPPPKSPFRPRAPYSLEPIPDAPTARPEDAEDWSFNPRHDLDAELARVNESIGALIDEENLASKTRGSNFHLVERATAYSSELADLIRERQHAVREFFLQEVFPTLMASQSGILDGIDVVTQAVKMRPDADNYNKLFQSVTREAVKAKTLVFLRKQFNLDGEEEHLFTELVRALLLPHGDSNDVRAETLLHKVLSILDVPRSEAANRSRVPLLGLQEDQAGSDGARPKAQATGAKGKRAGARKTAAKKRAPSKRQPKLSSPP